MADLIIRNGTLIDPASDQSCRADLVIEGGVIVNRDATSYTAEREIDAEGLIVAPGLIDIHVHLREPGKEAAETIATGTAAALAGGFSSVAAMPNTTPPLDKAERIRRQIAHADEASGARVYPVGCITTRRAGEQVADLEALATAGAVAFSDDGSGVADEGIIREAFAIACELDRPIMSHCEDPTLARGGVMHEGAVSAELGLPGQPAAAEEVMAARDIGMAAVTGGRLHIQHISSAGTLDLVREAKKAGINVTAEATPHHLALIDEDTRSGNADFKMNPPLRTATDREALRAALTDGTIDCIATDHAPHTVAEKRKGFRQAPFGCIGMESALAVLWTELVLGEVLTPAQLISLLTIQPARILGLPGGTLAIGAPADVTLIDPARRWRIDPAQFRSRSRNCPFAGRQVTGKVLATIVGGVVRFEQDISRP